MILSSNHITDLKERTVFKEIVAFRNHSYLPKLIQVVLLGKLRREYLLMIETEVVF